MSAENLSSAEMLKPEHLAEYEERLGSIWHELVSMRQSMHIVNSIVRFPLQQFAAPEDIGFFWQVLVNNCGDAVVLTLHSLANDNSGPRALNLRRFANSVLEWLRPEHAVAYRERLRDTRFEPELNGISKRIEALRHRVAHAQLPPTGEARPSISEAEAERLYQAVLKVFRAACLTCEHIVDINDYRIDKPYARAIDRVLDLVAKDSTFVNLPEIRGEWWPMHREHMDPEKIAEMNRWRMKFNLPQA